MELTAQNIAVILDMYRMPMDSQSWPAFITAYHLTPTRNVDTILAQGLIAKSCKATRWGEARREAVYIFGHINDTTDSNVRDFLFGEEANIAVLEIKIPRSSFVNLADDGLFNMSCVCVDGATPYGIQYTSNIPAEWISSK